MKSMEDKERYAREKAAFEEPPIETPQDDLDQKRKQRDVLMAMAPRHPLSSYVIFVSMNRNRISKLFPDRTFLETARLLGVVWRSMSREMKRKYMILAASDRLRFEEEKAEWDPPSILVGDAMNGPINNVGKENVVPSRPRKPTSAYAIWAAEERAAVLQEYPEIDRRELTKILRQNWKELTELERMPYEEQASRENAELEEILAKEKAEQEQQAAIPVNVPQNTRGASERDVFFHFGSPDASNRMGPVHNSGNFASMPPALESSKHNSIGIPTFASLPPAQTTLEPQTPIEEWNAAQIGQFIESLGLFQYSGAFAKSDLTGNTFVQLSTIDLKNTYGITSLGDRKKIRAAIDQKLTESI